MLRNVNFWSFVYGKQQAIISEPMLTNSHDTTWHSIKLNGWSYFNWHFKTWPSLVKEMACLLFDTNLATWTNFSESLTEIHICPLKIKCIWNILCKRVTILFRPKHRLDARMVIPSPMSCMYNNMPLSIFSTPPHSTLMSWPGNTFHVVA